jgi:hypothetical protein
MTDYSGSRVACRKEQELSVSKLMNTRFNLGSVLVCKWQDGPCIGMYVYYTESRKYIRNMLLEEAF